MELLFAYDERVAQDADGNYYAGSTFSQKVFDRYLQFFSHVTLIARLAKGEADLARMNRLDSSKVTVVTVPDLRENVRDLINPIKRRQVIETVKREILQDRAVIVRVPSTCGAIAADYCREIRKPYLVEVVGCPWDSYRNHSAAGKILAPYEYLQQRRVVRNADYALYVTEHFLQERYPCSGKTAAVSDVELPELDQTVLEARLRKISSHTGRMKIGTAGALIPYKGQQFVIEALEELKKEGRTDFEYHMAGVGDEGALKELAQKLGVGDQIVFEGQMSHDRMFAWFDSLDLYIQPSKAEGMPRALIEAMSRALPCFGSCVGGIPELLEEDCAFHAGSSKAITELLRVADAAELSEHASRNYQTAMRFQKKELEQRRCAFYAEFSDLSK